MIAGIPLPYIDSKEMIFSSLFRQSENMPMKDKTTSIDELSTWRNSIIGKRQIAGHYGGTIKSVLLFLMNNLLLER